MYNIKLSWSIMDQWNTIYKQPFIIIIIAEMITAK